MTADPLTNAARRARANGTTVDVELAKTDPARPCAECDRPLAHPDPRRRYHPDCLEQRRQRRQTVYNARKRAERNGTTVDVELARTLDPTPCRWCDQPLDPGRHPMATLHPACRTPHERATEAAARNGTSYTHERRIRLDGLPCAYCGTPIVDTTGRPRTGGWCDACQADGTARRHGRIRREYNLTADDARLVMTATRCAACRRPFTDERRPHVDHDHGTGAVRGVICGQCNIADGLTGSDPVRTIGLAVYQAGMRCHTYRDDQPLTVAWPADPDRIAAWTYTLAALAPWTATP